MRKYSHRLIDAFEAAVREDAWKGAGHPEDMPYIELAYKVAKKKLEDKMRELSIGSRARISELHTEIRRLKEHDRQAREAGSNT